MNIPFFKKNIQRQRTQFSSTKQQTPIFKLWNETKLKLKIIYFETNQSEKQCKWNDCPQKQKHVNTQMVSLLELRQGLG